MRRRAGAAREAREAERVEPRFAVEDVVGGQATERQQLEAVAGVDDRVGVREHPVADRIVVGGVGDDPAGEGRLPLGRPAAEAPDRRRQSRGEELDELGLRRVRRVVGAVGIEVGLGEQHREAAAGDRGTVASDAEVDPPRPGASSSPSRSERRGSDWSRRTTGGS